VPSKRQGCSVPGDPRTLPELLRADPRTAAELAEASGLSPSTIARLRRRGSTTRAYAALAAALGIDERLVKAADLRTRARANALEAADLEAAATAPSAPSGPARR
jgi:transcriptional regulator with XRE-family HTH domain